MKNIFFCWSLILMALAVFSCNPPEEGDEPGPPPVDPVPEIVIPAESATIFTEGISFSSPDPEQSQKAQVKFTATSAWQAAVDDTKSSTWLSLDPSSGKSGDVVMTITAQPNITGKDREAVVTLTCGEDKHSFSVSQSPYVKPPVDVESITLEKDKLTLVEGQSVTLKATVLPADADDKTVTWSTSDAEIATVEDGTVTAIKEGVAIITATVGKFSAGCEVTVKKYVVDPTSITLDNSSLALVKGQEETLIATVLPDDATDKTVSWSSSDAGIASVDENGKVTAINGGGATISATTVNGLSAQCQVTVTVPAASVTIEPGILSLQKGGAAKLEATVLPEDATDKTVSWSSSDAQVASVDENGNVAALQGGSATISATTANGLSAQCLVTVSVPVTSVAITPSSLRLLKGDTAKLEAKVLPEDATDKSVTWRSLDADVASVDENGNVTALKGGSAIVSVTTANGFTAQCQVTVTVPVASITINKSSLSLLEGRTAKLEATVLPEDATDKNVTWASDIPAVATVSADGTVTALSPGMVNITAKAGDVSAVCEVTVEAIKVSVAPVSVEIGPEGGTISVNVSSNVSWTSSSSAEWFSLSKTSADEGNTPVAITVSENETVDARSDQVIFTAEGRTATLSVSQKGIVPELSVAGPTEKLPASAGTYKLSVTSNIAWTLVSSESWLTTSVSSSAKGRVNVSFSVTQNDSTSERSATLTFTYGGQKLTHTVTQKSRDDISGFTGSIEDWEDEGAEFNKK